MLDHVARGSEVRTDAWTGYDDVGRYRFEHVVTNLSESGDPAHVVLPHVHLVASLLKRWILGTHQGAVSHSQLDYYLDEFTFRFNRRRARHRGLLFYRLLQGAVVAEPHRTRRSPANRPNSLDVPHIGGAKGIPSSARSTCGDGVAETPVRHAEQVRFARSGEASSEKMMSPPVSRLVGSK